MYYRLTFTSEGCVEVIESYDIKELAQIVSESVSIVYPPTVKIESFFGEIEGYSFEEYMDDFMKDLNPHR
jgi:hypothetical protein